jgi:hypothetical protein
MADTLHWEGGVTQNEIIFIKLKLNLFGKFQGKKNGDQI